ncbi:MAG: hypothetical protein ACREJN_16670, partial [Nitrospiraceae bacterium]
ARVRALLFFVTFADHRFVLDFSARTLDFRIAYTYIHVIRLPEGSSIIMRQNAAARVLPSSVVLHGLRQSRIE